MLFSTAIAFAEITFKRDLWNAVQHIQNINFSSWAVRNTLSGDYNIRLRLENWMPKIEGKVLMQISWANNVLWTWFNGSSIIHGKRNALSWSSSFIIVGQYNKISWNVTWGIILWGYSNTITGNSENSIIAWWANNFIRWGKNLLILWSKGCNLSWSESVIIWWGDVSLSWDSLVAFWHSIHIWTGLTNTFIWNDGAKDVLSGRDGAFLIYSKNGIGIGMPTSGTVEIGDMSWNTFVNVNWVFQFSWENISCNSSTAGSVQYSNTCYCWCNWAQWVSMTPTMKCKEWCSNSNITGPGPSCIKASQEVTRTRFNEIVVANSWACVDSSLITGSVIQSETASAGTGEWQCINSSSFQVATCRVWRRLP